MGTSSIDELERLLQGVRFRPPPSLNLVGRDKLFQPGRARGVSLAMGVAAAAALVLLILAFWTVLLGLKPD